MLFGQKSTVLAILLFDIIGFLELVLFGGGGGRVRYITK